jgi:NAD(P)-dependent dehydrogenase (short-subunit alcohol dehydrogenase family)
MNKKIVWITGAGKGIGRALALEMAVSGDIVAASARSRDDLDTLVAEAAERGGTIGAYPLDITDAAAARDVVARIERDLGPIKLAILNAGTHAELNGASFDLKVFRRVIDTNLYGTANCLAAVLPELVARKNGHVAIVGSLAGYRGLPTAGAYAASKAGLIALCEAMKPELDAAGVRLQLISPGFVDTPLTRRNSFAMPFLIPPEKAVDAILRGLGSRRFEIAFDWRMSLAMRLLKFLPYPLFFRITRGMVRAPRN